MDDQYLSLVSAANQVEPGDSESLCLTCGCDPCATPAHCAAVWEMNQPDFVPDEFTTRDEQCNVFHENCRSAEECEDFDYTRVVQCWRCRLWVSISDVDEFLKPGHAGSLAWPPCGSYGVLCNVYDPTYRALCQEPIDHAGLHEWHCHVWRFPEENDPRFAGDCCIAPLDHLGEHAWRLVKREGGFA